MPSMPPNIAELMNDVSKFHDEVVKVHATLLNPKHREIISEALGELKAAQADFEKTFPSAVEMMQAKAEKSKQRAEQFKAEKGQREAERNAVVEKAKAAAAQRKAQKKSVLEAANNPQMPKLPHVEMPKDWSKKLGNELIERFGRPLPVDLPPSAREGEIWEDWQWGEDVRG